jgi:hypothetical protein
LRRQIAKEAAPDKVAAKWESDPPDDARLFGLPFLAKEKLSAPAALDGQKDDPVAHIAD